MSTKYSFTKTEIINILNRNVIEKQEELSKINKFQNNHSWEKYTKILELINSYYKIYFHISNPNIEMKDDDVDYIYEQCFIYQNKYELYASYNNDWIFYIKYSNTNIKYLNLFGKNEQSIYSVIKNTIIYIYQKKFNLTNSEIETFASASYKLTEYIYALKSYNLYIKIENDIIFKCALLAIYIFGSFYLEQQDATYLQYFVEFMIKPVSFNHDVIKLSPLIYCEMFNNIYSLQRFTFN